MLTALAGWIVVACYLACCFALGARIGGRPESADPAARRPRPRAREETPER